MSKLKIAVVGNCQVSGLKQVLPLMHPSIAVTAAVGVHNLGAAKPEELDAIGKRLAEADLIFAMTVGGGFPEVVRSATIKSLYGDKALTYPNSYFRGYNPDLIYLRGPTRQHTFGALGDYHSEILVSAFLNGRSVADTVTALEREETFDYCAGVPAASLEELRGREAACDIKVADLIGDGWRQTRLFFTFNHPTTDFLARVAMELLTAAGVKNVQEVNASYAGEVMNIVVPTIPRGWYGRQGFAFPNLLGTRSPIEVDPATQAFKLGSARVVGLDDLVALSFRFYEAHDPAAHLGADAGRVRAILN